jgi:hypothetical protein
MSLAATWKSAESNVGGRLMVTKLVELQLSDVRRSLGVRGWTYDSAGAGPELTGGECLIRIGKGLCTSCMTSC